MICINSSTNKIELILLGKYKLIQFDLQLISV